MTHEHEYPPYELATIRHESLDSIDLPLIRGNYLYIRVYRPAGFTPGGLYIEKADKFPPIWGHVLAMAPSAIAYLRPYTLSPGDQVLFHRFSNERILEVPAREPLFPGERLDVQIVHIDSLQAVFSKNLVEMRV